MSSLEVQQLYVVQPLKDTINPLVAESATRVAIWNQVAPVSVAEGEAIPRLHCAVCMDATRPANST
jgi:hypothetical protein